MDVPADPVVAEVDVRRVERILRNLIGNAIEHSEGHPVLVRLAAREGAVAVTVRDHGVGLKPGEEKLVFNRFWRADPSRARQTGGTGLGLSISAEDARLHGGWLEAWGAPGQGAQFRLTVPARAGDRLVSSPLRLVPTDFRPPVDAEPEPWSANRAPTDDVERVDAHRPPSRPPAPRTPVTKPGQAARSGGAAARALRAARSTVAGRTEPPVAVEPRRWRWLTTASSGPYWSRRPPSRSSSRPSGVASPRPARPTSATRIAAGAQPGATSTPPPGPDDAQLPADLVSNYLKAAVESGTNVAVASASRQFLTPPTPRPRSTTRSTRRTRRTPLVIRLLGQPVDGRVRPTDRTPVDVRYEVVGTLTAQGRVDNLADPTRRRCGSG